MPGETAASDPRRALWRKPVRDMALSALCMLTGQTAEAAAEDPVLSLILRGAIAEASAVADAHGSGSTRHSSACGAAPDHAPSFLQDLELGQLMEVDAFVEGLLAFARSSNIETPMLERLSAIAVRRAIGVRPYQKAI